jgi:hypothetical protein
MKNEISKMNSTNQKTIDKSKSKKNILIISVFGCIGVGLVLFICMIVLILISRNTLKDNEDTGDKEDLVELLELYKDASLEYSAISNVKTSSMDYEVWISLISENDQKWNNIITNAESLKSKLNSAEYFRFKTVSAENVLQADTSALKVLDSESDFNLSYTIDDKLPDDIVSGLANDTKTVSQRIQTSLNEYKNTTKDEYQEAEYSFQLLKNGPPSTTELAFMALGNYIPFVNIDSNYTNAAQMELLARSMAYFSGADYALAKTKEGTIVFHKIAPDYGKEDYLLIDTAKVPENSSLFVLNSENKDKKIITYDNVANFVKDVNSSISIDVGLLDMSLIVTIDQDSSSEKKVTANTTTESHEEMLERMNLIKLVKSTFPHGDYRIGKNTITADGIETPTNTDNLVQTDNTKGTFTSNFIYTIPSYGGQESVQVQIIITDDNTATCNMTAIMPYGVFSIPEYPVPVGIESSGTGNLNGSYNTTRKILDCNGSISLTSSINVQGITNSATVTGNGDLNCRFNDVNTLSCSLYVTDIPDIDRVDFTAVRVE